MGNVITDISSLAATISAELQDWQMEKEAEVKRAIKKRAKECKTQIAATSPVRYGLYSQGWTENTAYESQRGIRIIVHNQHYPGLTHLLEHGHAIKPGGGRVTGIPHIKPAEEAAKEAVQEDIKQIYGGA